MQGCYCAKVNLLLIIGNGYVAYFVDMGKLVTFLAVLVGPIFEGQSLREAIFEGVGLGDKKCGIFRSPVHLVNGIFNQALSDAISITKRYFTSLFSMRS